MALGARIRRARKRAGLSALAVDRKADLTHGHTNAIERGVHKNPGVETVCAIAKAIGADIGELLGTDSVPPPKSAA